MSIFHSFSKRFGQGSAPGQPKIEPDGGVNLSSFALKFIGQPPGNLSLALEIESTEEIKHMTNKSVISLFQ